MYMYIAAAVLMAGLGWLALKSREAGTAKEKLDKTRKAARGRFARLAPAVEDFSKAPVRKKAKFGQVGR